MKTNKSYTKRIKVSRHGKHLARKPGLNHFNAKMSRNEELNKKRVQRLSLGKKIIRRFLPNS